MRKIRKAIKSVTTPNGRDFMKRAYGILQANDNT